MKKMNDNVKLRRQKRILVPEPKGISKALRTYHWNLLYI